MVAAKEILDFFVELIWIFICVKCNSAQNNETKIVHVHNKYHNNSFNLSYYLWDKSNGSLPDVVENLSEEKSDFDPSTNFSVNDSPPNSWRLTGSVWRLEYTVIVSVCGGVLVLFVITALVCWKRHKRIVHPPRSSVYSVQDGTWDSLSLHYIDNPAEFTKESWDEMSDDSFIASLDQAMARRRAPVAYYRNQAVLANGPASFRHSTSSTAPIVEPNPDSV